MTTDDLTAAVNRLTALCEYFELHGEWPGNRSDSNDIADLRAVLGEREQLFKRIVDDEDHSWALAIERDRFAARAVELEAERDAWREGVVTRLEQRIGKKATLVLAPKDQCTEQLPDGDRCELSAPHPGRLHRVRYGRGYCEWKALADYEADDTERDAREVVIGAGSPETSALTHCPTCGAPEWHADGRRGWNPVDVECEDCAGGDGDDD